MAFEGTLIVFELITLFMAICIGVLILYNYYLSGQFKLQYGTKYFLVAVILFVLAEILSFSRETNMITVPQVTYEIANEVNELVFFVFIILGLIVEMRGLSAKT
ncbi:MAG: hypothetical protein ABIE23_00840 [archaeon]|nr:hypothetical protein [Candidatus Micrarchaeota archaeon]